MGFNVLVVDDSAVMRAMVTKTLRLSGLPVGDIHEAANGEEALALINQNPIGLALIDINMPVMNGEQLIQEIRQDPQTASLPVIVVSTESSFTRISLLRKQGAEFVHKPFTPESLREAVAEITGVSYDEPIGEAAFPDGDLDF